MRDHEHDVAKHMSTTRIAVIGDSYAAALEVPLDRTFWSLLPKRLAGCGGTVEVLNFGVPAYGTAQEYLLLRDRALRYRPDLVLLVMTLGNDLENNRRSLEPVQERPFEVLEPSGGVRWDDTYRRTLTPGRLAAWRAFGLGVDNSRVLQLLHDARARYLAGQRLPPSLRHLVPPRDTAWAAAWHITEALVAAIDTLARRAGARLLVVSVSSPQQVPPDSGVARRLADSLDVPDLFVAERRLETLGGPTVFRFFRWRRHSRGMRP